MAYVEVKAKTVEMAIEAAMRELGVGDRDNLDIEIMQEPERGFLGFGGQDAIVKVKEKSGRARSRGRKGGRKDNGSGRSDRSNQSQSGDQGPNKPAGNSKPRDKANQAKQQPKQRQQKSNKGQQMKKDDDRDNLSAGDQAEIVESFLSGLVTAFGLEGGVETTVDDDIVIAEVKGEQTEALVGNRGAVMDAIHELSKTVLQRTARDSARLRLDVAGYAERRRQALTIYAGDLIEQIVRDGGELMLEPMSAADRKVIHDAVGQHDGVKSYSEGESPKRYVVIAATDSDGGEEE